MTADDILKFVLLFRYFYPLTDEPMLISLFKGENVCLHR
jgi:hypothetical protein